MTDIQIKDTTLIPQDCLNFIATDSAGAMTSFVGTVRNQSNDKTVLKLDFEAYKPMAIKEMQKIADYAKQKWKVEKIAIHHRVGSLKIGEIAVVIAVATPHRKASFAACEYCIDTLKETVPIWKKEFFEDGEIWVAAHP